MERKNPRKELEDALASANRHSEELENIMQDLHNTGAPNEDVADKISEKSHAWSKEMRRYVGAVKKMYGGEADEA